MIKINLNPERRKAKAVKRAGPPTLKIKNKALLYIGIPVILISAEIVYSVYLNTKINKLLEKKQQLVQERAKFKDVEKRINALKKAVAEAERLKETTKLKIAVFNKLASEKTDFIPMIKAIALSLPDGVWLKRVDILRTGGNLSGFAFNPKFISNFYDNLSDYYKTIKFNTVTKKEAKSAVRLKYYSFKFNMSGWKQNKQQKGGEDIESGKP
ncbi:type IV pilus assembly protein PilN [Persephonella hydrogeniphila]|uniref:Type IV pilus assembly protein PilN n=1 Tax=Persephonella hydrogeniphila TaxID=198703 RepID=A0A285N3P8_9AQUI|nr:PilN domain-containing protein [Persephonella hydrogeniphila]SNZ04104.1 type IV pilus assembly protein PilN [Persephonella hydrogeniphila]